MFVQSLFADILSVMAMTMGKPGARDSLNFRLAGTDMDLGTWVAALSP